MKDPSTSFTNATLGPKAYSKIIRVIDSDQFVYSDATGLQTETGILCKEFMNEVDFANRSNTSAPLLVQPMTVPTAPPCSPLSTAVVSPEGHIAGSFHPGHTSLFSNFNYIITSSVIKSELAKN